MKNLSRAIFCLVILSVTFLYAFGQTDRSKIEITPPKGYQPPTLSASANLDALLNEAVGTVLEPASGKGFKAEEIAATLIDLRDPQNLKWGNVSGEKPIYPAGVVKMFYMAALERQPQAGKLTLTPELSRGLKDKIVN